MDEASGGRFIFGLGSGRLEREYAAQGKSWGDRIGKLDEQIRLIQELLSGKSVSFSGKYYSAKDFLISPASRKIPIVLGGANKASVRRAARICDGIMPGHITPKDALDIRNIFLEEMGRIGKNSKQFTFYLESVLSIGNTTKEAEEKFRENTYVRRVSYASEIREKALVGKSDEIIKKIKEYGDAGVDEFVLIFADETLDSFLGSMELFAREVMPAFR